jgi:DNA-binding transcriptional LysR family regulator
MPIKEQRVPRTERRGAAKIETLDWESARVFLEISRQGSFRAAADVLRLSVNSLRRGLDKLERSLDVALLTRHVDGVRLTAEGKRVQAAAQHMELAAFELIRARDGGKGDLSGEIRIAATEGLGMFWVAPRIVEFQARHPNLLIDLNCAMQTVDVLRLEADVAIQLSRPQAKDLRLVKIGRIHTMPYAAQSYIDAYGHPKTVADLQSHRFVIQVSDQVASAQDYDRYFRGIPQVGRVAVRTNISSAHYSAIANGAGIGMLPTYVSVMNAPVVPLDFEFHTQHDIWLVYHSDANRITRVHELIDWLVDVFSPRRCPWFAEKFVHPRDLQRFASEFPPSPLFGAVAQIAKA